jgi:hypothetical protein
MDFSSSSSHFNTSPVQQILLHQNKILLFKKTNLVEMYRVFSLCALIVWRFSLGQKALFGTFKWFTSCWLVERSNGLFLGNSRQLIGAVVKLSLGKSKT